jgi:hypothetical protein
MNRSSDWLLMVPDMAKMEEYGVENSYRLIVLMFADMLIFLL